MKCKRRYSKNRNHCFSKIVHRQRISKGISYKTFGELIGLSQTRAFDFEHGELPELVDTVNIMASALQLTDECREQLTRAYCCGLLASAGMVNTCGKCPSDNSRET